MVQPAVTEENSAPEEAVLDAAIARRFLSNTLVRHPYVLSRNSSMLDWNTGHIEHSVRSNR